MKKILTAISLGLALLAALVLTIWPVYSGFTGGHETRATLLDVNGLYALVPVLIPVLLALMPVVYPKQPMRIGITVLLWLFVVLGGMSIGLFYAPAALFMLLAACVATPSNGL